MEQRTGHRHQGRTQQRIDTLKGLAESLRRNHDARTVEEKHRHLMSFYVTQPDRILEVILPQAEAREDYEAMRAITEILCNRCVRALIQELNG